jgi:hypothetical protein
MSAGMIPAKALLQPPITAEYEPPDLSLSAHWFHPNRPLFTVWHVDAMLTEARVIFGLLLLRGPILSNSRFLVKTGSVALHDYIVNQINRFWRSAGIALRALDYGYLGTEVLYRAKDNQLQFDRLKFLHPHNTKVVTKKGEMCGMEVTRVGQVEKIYIGRPKMFWTVHQRDQHIWYGRSRLRGAFMAWHEIWSDHGYRDQRRLWFYKNAYAGYKIGYPLGSAPSEVQGQPQTPHRIIAQTIADRSVSGTGIVYPMVGDGKQGGWQIEDPRPIPIPEGLLEYGDTLNDEIWEGMGIPPEVARAEGTGAFAGRRVPQMAFYASLQEIVQELINDFDEQILTPLVRMNFGTAASYEIDCFGLLRSDEEDQQQGQQQQVPGQDEGGEPLLQSVVLPEHLAHLRSPFFEAPARGVCLARNFDISRVPAERLMYHAHRAAA